MTEPTRLALAFAAGIVIVAVHPLAGAAILAAVVLSRAGDG